MSDIDTIFDRYVADLAAALPGLTAWWDALNAAGKYDGRTYPLSRMWVCRLGAHPRLVAIFRQYWLEVAHLVETERARLEAAAARRELDPELSWGVDDDPGPEMPNHPNDVLLGRLKEQRPDLFEHFRFFTLRPIGMDDVALTSEEAGRG